MAEMQDNPGGAIESLMKICRPLSKNGLDTVIEKAIRVYMTEQNITEEDIRQLPEWHGPEVPRATFKPPRAIANGVTRTECFWGYYLEGTKDALLEAGLAQPEWFADGTQRNEYGKVIRTLYFRHGGRDCECRMEQRKGWYHLRVIYSQTELGQRIGSPRGLVEQARRNEGFRRFLERALEPVGKKRRK